MNNSHLQKVLRLIRKTRDRVVVLDQESDDVLVILRLEDYEDLVDATKTVSNTGSNAESNNNQESILPSPADEEQFTSPPGGAPLPSQNIHSFPNAKQKLDFSSDWQEQNASHFEPLDSLPEDEVEEKFYPEPVE
ncbi:MAG: hypothetical protein Q7K39_02035 [Candidatus Magasanikbacteria bacterium]|nr:hypothetical protein [Candidatus Magasanikbacteria bacterium]